MKNKLISGVMELSEKFTKNPSHVWMTCKGITETAALIKEGLKDGKDFWLGYPKCLISSDRETPPKENRLDQELFLYELIAGSINYQYWYGVHDCRPNNAGATLMYELLDQAFAEERSEIFGHDRLPNLCQDVIGNFVSKLTLYRFPNLTDRIRHLREIAAGMGCYGYKSLRHSWRIEETSETVVDKIKSGKIGVEKFIQLIITTYPGYGEDMFLKRIFLLGMMLYRRVQWFKDEIEKVPVPADYQIPKMLSHLGCLYYSPLLQAKISNNELIPRGSLEECEIRATSIMVCKEIAELAGCSMCDVDTYLWLRRKDCEGAFHLTATSDY
ncbi:MAG: queuosine salvage family protein [Candidatus Asgardarchaeia archaeon]